MAERVTILGSTGSIGVSTLDVLARHPERFRIHALTARNNVELLAAQCLSYHPEYAVLLDQTAAQVLRDRLRAQGCATEVLVGAEALSLVAEAPRVDVVMAGIVGAAGLLPTLAAARAGKRLLLANKEALVLSGSLLMQAVKDSGAILLPVDSEHNAIYQCLPAAYRCGQPLDSVGAAELWLTASGGPFRDRDPATFADITPEEACAHPNWDMGQKISVDSATMMNKGLEVIEAHWLFALSPERIRVILHPQSIIHSMVRFLDGSVLAQMGRPDMRTPIAYSLSWPERIDSGVAALDLLAVGRLDFTEPSAERFPCLDLAYQALAAGGTATAVLNAANEVAVAAFLAGRLRFPDIAQVIAGTLAGIPVQAADSLASILDADTQARQLAEVHVQTAAPRNAILNL